MNEDNFLFNVFALLIGVLYGVAAQRKQFCFSGGIKDIVLFKHTKRTASLLAAMITAIISTQLLSHVYNIDLTASSYFSNINYLFIIIGGALFGFGMMISDGCSSRHLVKLSQGEKDSFFILLGLGIFSYLTYKFFSAYYNEIFSISLLKATTIDLVGTIPLYLVLPVLFILLYKNLKSVKNILQCWDGICIGLIIAFAWFITTAAAEEFFTTIKAQSLSFVYPVGKIFEYIKSGFDGQYLIFSVWIVIGVVIGAFFSSRFNKEFSKKQACDNSGLNPPKLPVKIFGGALMGIGGILAIGCTVGQGLSGMSTLAATSFAAAGSIYASAFITAKYLHKKNALIACFIFDFKNRD